MALLETITSWNEGVTAYQSGEYREALQRFADVPDPSARILFNMACASLQLNRRKDALEYLDACTQKDPHLAIGYYHKGIQNLRLQRYSEADIDLENALQKMRGCPFIDYTQLGMVYKLFTYQIQSAKAVSLAQRGKVREAIKTMIDASQDTDEDVFKRRAVNIIHTLKTEPGQTIEPEDIPSSHIFHPPKNLIANLKKRDYVGKAKVITSYSRKENKTSREENKSKDRFPPPPNRAPPSLPMRPAKSVENLQSAALQSSKPQKEPHVRHHSDQDDVNLPRTKPKRPPLPSTISNESTYEPLIKSHLSKSMDDIFDPDLYEDDDYEDADTSSKVSTSKGRNSVGNELSKVLAARFGNMQMEKKQDTNRNGNNHKQNSNNDSSPKLNKRKLDKDSSPSLPERKPKNSDLCKFSSTDAPPPPIPKRIPARDSVLNNPLPAVPTERDSSDNISRRPPPPSYLPPPPPKTGKSKALK